RFIGCVHEPAGGRRHLAHQVGLAGVGDVAIFFQRDVEIDDVPVLQNVLRRGDSVAYHLVAGGVERVGVPVLPLAGRTCMQLMHDEVFDQVVDLHGGDADQVQPVEVIEHLCQ